MTTNTIGEKIMSSKLYKKDMQTRILSMLVFALTALFGIGLFAQGEATRTELELILSRYTNYRFGTISIYRLKNVGDVRRAIKARQEASSGIQLDESILKSVDERILNKVENGVTAGEDLSSIIESIERKGLIAPERTILEPVYQYYRRKIEGGAEQRVENAFLITTRAPKGEIPNSIIALIVSYNPSPDLEKSLKRVGSSDIYTYDEMKNFKLDTTFTANNLYDLMLTALIQRNVENKTIEAQGLGNPQWFAPKVFGQTKSPFTNEADLSTFDVQTILRVSEGEPFIFGLKQNELVLSPDWILWRRYPTPGYYDDNGNFVVDTLGSSNYDLPSFGIELKYGIEGINYYSFFSERLTMSAIWQNVKLGVILPTDGWAGLGKDLFDIPRKLTFANFGIAGSFDFPIKVIPKSGVFHFDFGYVVGNAKESKYKNRKIDPLTYIPAETIANEDFDYLIRANLQAYYTFGMRIDDNYYFRFGLGGTFYQLERWYNDLDTSTLEQKLIFKKYDEKSVGDVSVRIDFMATNITTPFGLNAQYFNGGIGGGIWLQVPIIQNTLSLRLDVSGNFALFKNTPELWENKGYVVPMARFIVNF